MEEQQQPAKGPLCQSCGRPMGSTEEHGTNADGTRTADYCLRCFRFGNFTEPAITRDQMTEQTAEYLAQQLGLDQGRAREEATRLLPQLTRWGGLIGRFARKWWTLTVRGVLAVLLGVLLLVWPGRSLMAIVIFFGAFAFLNGVFALVSASTAKGPRPWWTVALEGVAGIAVGLVTFLYPGITAMVLYTVIGAWAIAIGVMEIIAAIRLRKEVRREPWLVLSGAVSVGFGVMMFALPLAGMLTLAWFIGIYAIIFGALLIALSLRLRGIGRVLSGRKPMLQPA